MRDGKQLPVLDLAAAHPSDTMLALRDLVERQARAGDTDGALASAAAGGKPVFYNALARVQASAGDLEGARHTASLSPDGGGTWIADALAGAYVRRGDVEKTLEMVEHGAEVPPDLGGPVYAAIDGLIERGETDRAVQFIPRLDQSWKRRQLLLKAADAYAAAGRPDDARAALERLLVPAPSRHDALAVFDAAAKRGDLATAERAAGMITPPEPDALKRLAALRRAHGHERSSRAALDLAARHAAAAADRPGAEVPDLVAAALAQNDAGDPDGFDRYMAAARRAAERQSLFEPPTGDPWSPIARGYRAAGREHELLNILRQLPDPTDRVALCMAVAHMLQREPIARIG